MTNPQRLPPIQYLVVFATAARLSSFKLASQALSITPSAVSQQIKSLEGHVGVTLFNREQRALKLTLAGEDFYRVADRTLRQYEQGFTQFSSQHLSSALRVSMIPYVANEVLIPHLHEFQQAYPGIRLLIETSSEIEDLHCSELDAAIRFGVPPWGDLNAELICQVKSGLVASEQYLREFPMGHSQDWSQQTLIHSRNQVNDWQRYMEETGIHFEPKNELHFDSYYAAMRAAEEGLGIMIAVFPLSQHSINSGELVMLFEHTALLPEGLYLLTKDNERKSANYKCLLKWLQAIF